MIYRFQYQTKFWSHKHHHRHQMIQININTERSRHTFTVSKNLHFLANFCHSLLFKKKKKKHFLLVFGCVFLFPFNEEKKTNLCMTLCVSFNICYLNFIFMNIFYTYDVDVCTQHLFFMLSKIKILLFSFQTT